MIEGSRSACSDKTLYKNRSRTVHYNTMDCNSSELRNGDNEDHEGGPDDEANYVTHSFHQALI